mmetsp:Transcript_53170/g.129108  ORF Transcript_53170/g.129108 Transcript_53170/m.129108 type:complete len:213 (+) Transcript_53170:356-994(+)
MASSTGEFSKAVTATGDTNIFDCLGFSGEELGGSECSGERDFEVPFSKKFGLVGFFNAARSSSYDCCFFCNFSTSFESVHSLIIFFTFASFLLRVDASYRTAGDAFFWTGEMKVFVSRSAGGFLIESVGTSFGSSLIVSPAANASEDSDGMTGSSALTEEGIPCRALLSFVGVGLRTSNVSFGGESNSLIRSASLLDGLRVGGLRSTLRPGL